MNPSFSTGSFTKRIIKRYQTTLSFLRIVVVCILSSILRKPPDASTIMFASNCYILSVLSSTGMKGKRTWLMFITMLMTMNSRHDLEEDSGSSWEWYWLRLSVCISLFTLFLPRNFCSQQTFVERKEDEDEQGVFGLEFFLLFLKMRMCPSRELATWDVLLHVSVSDDHDDHGESF